jgi:hypothetical protein
MSTSGLDSTAGLDYNPQLNQTRPRCSINSSFGL